MKYSEIKNLSLDELNKRYKNLVEESFQLKMKHSLGQVGNPLQIRHVRRDIARFKMALKERFINFTSVSAEKTGKSEENPLNFTPSSNKERVKEEARELKKVEEPEVKEKESKKDQA